MIVLYEVKNYVNQLKFLEMQIIQKGLTRKIA